MDTPDTGWRDQGLWASAGPHTGLRGTPSASTTVSVAPVRAPSHPGWAEPLPPRQGGCWACGEGRGAARATKSVHACHQSGPRKAPERK